MVFIKKQGHVLEIHLVQQREQRIRVTVKDMRLSIPLSPKKVKGRKRRQKKRKLKTINSGLNTIYKIYKSSWIFSLCQSLNFIKSPFHLTTMEAQIGNP